MKPITPAEATQSRITSIPDYVIQAFNTMITKEIRGNRASVRQEDVMALIVQACGSRQMIFDNRWLDVEKLYEAAGWSVKYDKPGYNETYEARFIFTASRHHSYPEF